MSDNGIEVDRRPAVVVIDDDPSIRHLLQDCLELDGFEVHTSADGSGGLALVAQSEPACVVLDVTMPELDGHGVLKLLRERHGFDVPVIMLTAAADDEQAWQAWTGGVDCFMTKPFQVEALLRQVADLCRTASTADESALA